MIADSGWQPVVSGNARLHLTQVLAGRLPALEMDFDFQGGGGFVVARCALPRAMPEEYAVTFRLRGRGPVNNFELKLVDATGQNVWRHVLKDLDPPRRWRRLRIPSEDIDFAWGPLGSGRITTLGSVELAIVAGAGGSGTCWISELEIEDCTPKTAPKITASSASPDFEASVTPSGFAWRPRHDDRRPWIAIDWTDRRTIGGLIIDWREHAPAKGFRVRASNDGTRWKTVRDAPRSSGRRSYVYLPRLSARCFKLELNEASAGAEIRVQSFEFSRSINAFWNSIATGESRGWHPRWLHREQSLWTPFGISHGNHCGLLNEDGMAEVGLGSFSIEPMVWQKDRLTTWADVRASQELAQGWMPVPSVTWETADWRLNVEAQATPSGAASLRYRLQNLTAQPLSGRLFLLVRPFQVTPPWQGFRDLGGVSPIRAAKWRDGIVHIDDTIRLVPKSADESGPVRFGALRFDEGFMPAFLAAGVLPDATDVIDPFGFATAAIGFDFAVPPHEAREYTVSCAPDAAGAVHAEPDFDWASLLPVSQWLGNGWAKDVSEAALTATAHVLITRCGAALQPGPRRYRRSWIRDGTIMGAALLRMGHIDEVRDYLRWYAQAQRADGFVPCCIDEEGPDWLVEHDSHGQLLCLIADYFRFSSDAALVEELWPNLEKAAEFIESALDTKGLMPVSVSHEGYLAQPVHSFWDDFWTLRGLSDAAALAHHTGRQASSRRWQELSVSLSASLYASIETTRAERGLDFIPGSIEWADFDPTATANAIYLLDVPADLNREALERTFDKYLDDWRGKRSGAVPWSNYTPYEVRIVGALVRLGRRDSALELLRFFLSDRRPLHWNQWPEIAWRDQRAPAHLGDLPHTWIAAEYVLAVRCLFAYEREAEHALIVAAGVAPEWLEAEGVRVSAMPTLYGALSYSLRKLDAMTLRFEKEAGFTANIVLRPPLAAPLREVIVDGVAIEDFDAQSINVPRSASEVICITAP